MYRYAFYQLPHFFFTTAPYDQLSLQAKVMWSLLRHRHELSVKNGWQDSEGKVYVICTNETLGEWLGIKSRQTIAKVKRELKAIGLLKERRRGNNEPNYLYVLFPKKVQGLNITDDLIDEGQHERQKKKQQLEEEAFYSSNEVPERIRETIRLYSHTPEDAKRYYGILNGAKRKFSMRANFPVRWEEDEDLEREVCRTFIRAVRHIEHSGEVRSPSGYLYEAIYFTLFKWFSSNYPHLL